MGHLVMAVGMLDAKVAEAQKLSGEPIPAETVLRLKHMIVSHHGEYAFGSPKLPMTLEAVALCYPRQPRRQAEHVLASDEGRPQRRQRLDHVQRQSRSKTVQGKKGGRGDGEGREAHGSLTARWSNVPYDADRQLVVQ